MTISILLTLTIAATSTIRNSIDLRIGLSQQVKVSHGINVVMQRVVTDLEQVFLVSTKRQEYNPGTRATKTIFQLDSSGRLMMTTMSHAPVQAGSPESDQTLVVYELRDDRDMPGMKNLYRGETKVIPRRFQDDVPMVLLAKGVQKFAILPWTGAKWSDARWNTNKSEHRNKLPRMVKIELQLLELDELAGAETRSIENIPLARLATVVYLPKSWGFQEYKPYSGSLKWL